MESFIIIYTQGLDTKIWHLCDTKNQMYDLLVLFNYPSSRLFSQTPSMQKRKTLAQSLKCLKVSIQGLPTTLNCFITYSIVHAFWNEIIFACITEKYMEFDLNDKGDIGKIALALKPSNIFSYSLQLLLSVSHTSSQIIGMRKFSLFAFFEWSTL